METFKEAKKKFKQAFTEILTNKNSYENDEAALPAYAHKNPLIDYLFWKRLQVVFNFAKENNFKNVLDFGCGSGVMSYLMAQNGISVTSSDIEFSPLRLVKEKIDFPAQINFIEGDIINKNLPENSFDLIVALDVLEHIENLDEYIKLFERLLKPNGVIIVSGPTENILYKIGRKISGERFTGNYHVTNIKTIKKQFSEHLIIKTLRRLVFPVILFEVFIAKSEKK